MSMALTIFIDIKPDQIIVSESKLNYRFVYKNMIAIDTSSRKIVEVGKTGDEIEQEAPQVWARDKAQVIFEKIYEPECFDPERILLILYFFIAKIRNSRSGGLFERILHAFDRITLNLTLPDYHHIDERARNLFELGIPEIAKARNLIINQASVETFHVQRKLISWSYQLFIALGMVILPYVTLPVFGSLASSQNIDGLVDLISFLAFLLITGTVGALAGIISWFLLARLIFPSTFLMYLVTHRRLIPSFIMWFFKPAINI